MELLIPTSFSHIYPAIPNCYRFASSRISLIRPWAISNLPKDIFQCRPSHYSTT